jgi:hypothetical protein
MEFWALSSFDAMAMGCVFALGALVGFAASRFLPRKEIA